MLPYHKFSWLCIFAEMCQLHSSCMHLLRVHKLSHFCPCRAAATIQLAGVWCLRGPSPGCPQLPSGLATTPLTWRAATATPAPAHPPHRSAPSSPSSHLFEPNHLEAGCPGLPSGPAVTSLAYHAAMAAPAPVHLRIGLDPPPGFARHAADTSICLKKDIQGSCCDTFCLLLDLW